MFIVLVQCHVRVFPASLKQLLRTLLLSLVEVGDARVQIYVHTAAIIINSAAVCGLACSAHVQVLVLLPALVASFHSAERSIRVHQDTMHGKSNKYVYRVLFYLY